MKTTHDVLIAQVRAERFGAQENINEIRAILDDLEEAYRALASGDLSEADKPGLISVLHLFRAHCRQFVSDYKSLFNPALEQKPAVEIPGGSEGAAPPGFHPSPYQPRGVWGA